MHVQRHAPPVEIRRPEVEALTDLDGAGQGPLIARGDARSRSHG